MKRLLTLIASVVALSSLTACGSNDINMNQFPIETVSVMNVEKVDVLNIMKNRGEHTHTVVYTMYQDPATHDKAMKMQIDFACPEGDKDVLVASSSPSSPYNLAITHHSGKTENFDLKNKEKVTKLVSFIKTLIITNDADKKVVGILLQDLNGFLKSKNLRKATR